MKKYNVRLEINRNVIDLADIKVYANSIEQAKDEAVKQYYRNPKIVEDTIRESEDSETSYINMTYISDWVVEEVG